MATPSHLRPTKEDDSIPRWVEVEAAAPELAARARGFLDAHVHKTIATLRHDGSPRISGTECLFTDGDLWFGSMWRATKALDLLRDPRFALHSGSADPPGWDGDAKVSGTVEEVTDHERVAAVLGKEFSETGRSHLFRADILELVVVSLNADRTKLVIESWHPGRGVTRSER